MHSEHCPAPPSHENEHAWQSALHLHAAPVFVFLPAHAVLSSVNVEVVVMVVVDGCVVGVVDSVVLVPVVAVFVDVLVVCVLVVAVRVVVVRVVAVRVVVVRVVAVRVVVVVLLVMVLVVTVEVVLGVTVGVEVTVVVNFWYVRCASQIAPIVSEMTCQIMS